jgi:hypothetical protein
MLASSKMPCFICIHPHRSPVPASELGRQFLGEDRHHSAIRRANMSGQISRRAVFVALRSKQH